MTTYHIRHCNNYKYQSPVVTSHHRLHLSPHIAFGQVLHKHEFKIDVLGSQLHKLVDSFGNAERHLEINTPYKSLSIVASSEVAVDRLAPDPSLDTQAWDQMPNLAAVQEQFRWNSPHIARSQEAADYVRQSFPPGQTIVAGLLDLVVRIFNDFTYDPVATDISTPVEEVLRHRGGVCQDFAHVGIAGLRSSGLAAAYVSGYVETAPPAGSTRLIGADASHAWLALWHPVLGWVHADPTNGCLVADRHIVVALARDFSDVSPITGILFGGGAQNHNIAVDVIPDREWSQFPWIQNAFTSA